jgi:hypothetical protein
MSAGTGCEDDTNAAAGFKRSLRRNVLTDDDQKDLLWAGVKTHRAL